MQSERWQSCTDIFNAAVERPHNARAALLERSCNGDEALRRKVELLLKYHDESGDFIDSPAFVVAPELLVDDPDALIGQHLGSYRIDAVLGAGGMGVVYLACDERLGRKVGLKLLPQSLVAKEERFERLKREARTASALNHPNIMTIHEVGEVDSAHYIATEFIEGATLRERMTKGPIPPDEALNIAIQVATALCVAHGAGIVHRDIKPENIMLRPDGYVKVLDFGIAKFTQLETLAATTSAGVPAATQQGLILGTTRYMSPDQARGQTVDARSDLWSLGVVLYEMLAGRPPFDGATPTDVIAAVLLKRPEPVEQRATIVPPALQRVVEKSLRKDPAERYQTAEEMLSELRAIEGRPDRIALRSNAARWIGVAAVAALLVSLGVFYGWRERRVPRNGPPAAIEKSIAVLPFENLSKDEENAFFTDGVQDEILTKLAKIADLKVISRASVMQYKNAAPRNLGEIAQQLGVYHLLEGSVQRAAQRVRVNARLVDARNHAQLWAQTYDRDLADVFAIQSEIAASIAEQLKTHLSAREKAAIAKAPTHDLAANDLYVRAKELWASAEADPGGKQNLLKAVRLLEEAVTHDPGFVVAYCLLCTIQVDIYWIGFDHSPARRELAATALRNATRLQPDAGEVHAARANYAYHGFRDYDRARAELDLARRILPNNAELYWYIASIDRRQARWNEAIRNFERAIELDPRNFSIVVEAAFTHCGLRRFAESRQLLERALSISPGDHFVRSELVRLDFLGRGELDSWRNQLSAIENEGSAAASRMAFQLVWCALAARDREAAARALTFIPPEGVVDVRSNALFPREWLVGLVAKSFGDKAGAQTAFTAARPILERMTVAQPEYAPAWSLLGMIDAALGRKENAIREGRHACELLPVSKDSWEGTSWVTNLATIYAWIGENDAALQQLENSAGNFGVAFGELKLFPIWDSLRSDPRFDQILASLAPKDEAGGRGGERDDDRAGAPALTEKSIAVLPFENLSAEADNAFFADGIQDDVLTTVGKIKDLKVIARSSVMDYRGARLAGKVREIGRTLHVSHVLEGSVRRIADRVVVNVALIDTRDERQVWSQRYERTLTDSLSLQGELAVEIARALGATLTPAEAMVAAAKPTQNAEAYLLYLRAREIEIEAWSAEENEAAIKLYQQAIDLDPTFALARARLSMCASQRAHWGEASGWKAKAGAEAEEAARNRPELGEAHLALTHYYLFGEDDHSRALHELDRAAELLPNSAEVPLTAAFIYKRQARFRARIAALHRAEVLDPRNAKVLGYLTNTFRWVRGWPQAMQTFDRYTALTPEWQSCTWRWRRAHDEFQLSGDIHALKKAIAEQPNAEEPATRDLLNVERYETATLERDYTEAARLLAAIPSALLGETQDPTSPHWKAFHEALLAVAANTEGKQEALERARIAAEARAWAVPEPLGLDRPQEDLALLYAFLGRKEDAICQAHRAVDHAPAPAGTIEKNGASAALAMVYAQTGEPDKAINLIEHLLTVPGELQSGAVYNMTLTDLKWRWQWDPLRSHPRFQKILAGPEPKTIY